MSEHEQTSDSAAADSHLTPEASERSELPPLRTYNAFARFDDPEKARDLILSLERSGIDGRYISAIELTEENAPASAGETDAETERREAIEEDKAFAHEIVVDGAKGGSLGAVLGAIGGTAVALAIPGLGLAAGAGLLAVAAGGAVAGVGVGTFAGALSHTPASRSWQRALVDLEHGEIVVGVHTDEKDVFDKGVEILEESSPRSLRRVDHEGEVVS